MGKTLVIKGADFSEVSVEKLDDKVINFSTATVKNYNIAETSSVLKLIAPTTGDPSFYEIDCSGYDKLVITIDGGRLLITNAALPSSSTGKGTNIESYVAGSKSTSYFSSLTGTNYEITLPSSAKYIYIRKTTGSAVDTTPSSATLKAV